MMLRHHHGSAQHPLAAQAAANLTAMAGMAGAGGSSSSRMMPMEDDTRLPVAVQLPSPGQILSEVSGAQAQLAFCSLNSSSQWLAELAISLPDSDDLVGDSPSSSSTSWPWPRRPPARVERRVALARAHFGVREYGRAAQCLEALTPQELESFPPALFLRLYGLYLYGEKRREEESFQSNECKEHRLGNPELNGIEITLAALAETGRLKDGLLLYLYGIVLKGLDRKADARQALVKSVEAFPWNWSAWLDLMALLVDSEASLDPLSSSSSSSSFFATLDAARKHWMIHFFDGAWLLEQQKNEDSASVYRQLREGFPHSTYIATQLALCEYNLRNFDPAQALFEEVIRQDPYKLSCLDTFSNILYVKEQAVALSHLARQVIAIDKYTPEVCCIIGNYYSLKGEHEKSVTSFRRALALNSQFTPAWILMGHEYMEMRNPSAAVEAYHSAVNVNQRDYRAWYGLGQTYEMLNLHFYALFYYRRALQLRPQDARMWCAVADCYDAMERTAEAINCYQRAQRWGDRERVALPRLAKVHARIGQQKQAAACYEKLLQELDVDLSELPVSGQSLHSDLVSALHFLMIHYRDEGRLAECEICATRLLDSSGAEKEEAKVVLHELRTVCGAGGGRFPTEFARRNM
mmetsp:Transcript_98791/g.205940  ORF Transcript_98791/g.205940 Transcript_98791/m.205940 type:complete len:636 (+) Transcript_98791:76-1983(+)